MDQIIMISNKWHYQDVFSEFLYFPLFLSKNSQNEKVLVLLNEVTFSEVNLNESFPSPILPLISFHF